MIIIGEITGYDIGKEDVLVHIQDEHGTWYKCIGDAPIYESAIRLLAKNKDRVKITGDLREREIYHTPGVQQEVLIISFLEQIMPAHEDFNFRLTGALY